MAASQQRRCLLDNWAYDPEPVFDMSGPVLVVQLVLHSSILHTPYILLGFLLPLLVCI